MAPIRKGDGTGFTPKGFAGVRKGDGTILYSAEPAIPDIGDHQWYINEGSGTTLNDNVGSVTATINGASWQSESGPVGGQYLSHDGADDYWVTDSALTLDQATVCGWVRPNDYTGFSNQFVSWGDNINGDSGTSGFYVDTEDTAAEILTATADGIDGGSVLRNVSFVPTGSWGFFALIYDGTSHRLITFDNSSELADQNASINTANRPSGSTSIYGGGNPGDSAHLNGDTDFFVAAANRTLTKTEITDLWEATKR